MKPMEKIDVEKLGWEEYEPGKFQPHSHSVSQAIKQLAEKINEIIDELDKKMPFL